MANDHLVERWQDTTSILRQLSWLRRRERALRFVWGAARVVALAFVVLVLACVTDYLVDRWQDTPWSLRSGLLLGQELLLAFTLFFFVLRPLFRRLPDDQLALWIEEKKPAFGHRLISAVQLNRPGARLQGMSPELIALVTKEAEDMARQSDFGAALDRRRLKWSLYALAPVALVAAGLFIAFPVLVQELLARQWLRDQPITRSVTLLADQDRIVPAGDPVDVFLTATGTGWNEQMKGRLRIAPEGMPAENFVLEFARKDEEGRGIFVAHVPQTSVPFEYRGWLGDGRTRAPGKVHFEPRPATKDLKAYLILPEYVGKRPSGGRYEELLDKGDIVGWPDCDARIEVTANKPLTEAVLELLGTDPQSEAERVTRTFPIKPTPASDSVTFRFALKPGESAYRIRMKDLHGFESKQLPRKSITMHPDEPPQVVLLPEYFYGESMTSNLEDTEFDGIPVPLGEPIRIAYKTRTPLALERAVLRYRILKPMANVEPNNPPWETLPLTEVLRTEQAGDFDLARGCFQNSPASAQIGFHAIASDNPERTRGRQEGGGRFDWETRGLPELKEGDRVEFYIEVYDRKPGKPPGSSEVRLKEVLDYKKVLAWVKQKRDETARLKQLEAKQTGLFDPSSPPK
jgi:hypothetical protein